MLNKKGLKMKIKLLNNAKEPIRKRNGDAAWDIYMNQDTIFKAGELSVFDTDIAVEIPYGYMGLLLLRSSSVKMGLMSSPIAIDSNYRGNLKGLVRNMSNKDIAVKKGDRIYSLVVVPILTENLEVVNELSETDRGENWNGSSGK